MFLQKSWMYAAAASLCAASALAQAPLSIEAYVGIVLKAHPRAGQTRAVETLVAAERRAAGAWPDPVFGASLGRAKALPDGGLRGGERDYSISQTFPWPSARSARVRAAELAGHGLLSAEEAARWDLELEARFSFWRLLFARRALELARRADADALAILDLTSRRVEVGESREADRSRALAERLRAELALRNAEREARVSETAVRLLAVAPLPSPLELGPERPSPLTLEEIEARRNAMGESSPLLRRARVAVAQEMGLVEVARAARAPDIDLSFLQARELDKKSWSLAFGVRLPLWNGGRAELVRAEASASLARTALERSRLEVALAFEGAAQEAQAAGDGLLLLEKSLVPTARRTWDLVRLSYEAGETSLLDLLDAQRTLRELEGQELAAGLGLGLASMELDRIGGRHLGMRAKQ